MQKKSATSRVLATLSSGKTLTAAQIAKRFGLKNPHSPIYQLKQAGYDISLENGKYSM